MDVIEEFAVVGAPNASSNGTMSGSALVYRRVTDSTNEWVEWQTLLPATVDAGDQFGRSVAITEELIAVGAINDADVGSVTLFARDQSGSNTWQEMTRIVPTNLIAGSEFGLAVSLDGDRLAVGAPYADLSGTGITAGAVFVFDRHEGGTNAWGEVMRWAPTNAGSADARAGWSVSLSGEHLVVGAERFDVDPGESGLEGAVFHLYSSGGSPWAVEEMIAAAETNLSSTFGWSVSLENDVLVVGAPWMSAGGAASAGRIFVYELATNRFLNTAELDRRNDGERRFGYSVCLSGPDVLLVGAPHNVGAHNVGAAYLYYRDPDDPSDWDLAKTLRRPSGSSAGLFGTSVSINTGTSAVGAPADINQLSNNGYVFLYRFGYNTPPVLMQAIPDQVAEVAQPFSFTLPSGVFADPDDDEIVLEVLFPDGTNGLAFSEGVLSGIPLTTGVMRIEVWAGDMRGGSTSTTFTVTVVSAGMRVRREWEQDWFGSAATEGVFKTTLWGGDADPDGDGMNNDHEYAFGGDPLAADQCVIMLERDGGEDVITYTRRWNDPDLVFGLRASSDLMTWFDHATFIVVEQTVHIDGEFETAVLRVAVHPDQLHLFYRIVGHWQ